MPKIRDVAWAEERLVHMMARSRLIKDVWQKDATSESLLSLLRAQKSDVLALLDALSRNQPVRK